MALDGTIWTLVAFDGAGGSDAPIADTRITLSFAGQDHHAGGSSGCNRYTGGYTEAGDQLTFGPLASTRMWCASPEGVMEQEQRYLAALQQAARYEVTDSQLRIDCGETTLAFDAVA
jgi:putative lipoprotein